jgi:hypothetical protein
MDSKAETAPPRDTAVSSDVGRPDEKVAANDQQWEHGALKETHSSESIEPDPSSPEGYYRNFQPIRELNLPDWQRTEKQLVKRLDLTLMPTLWLLYLNNYLDRTNIAQARLNTLDEDLNLTGADYSTAVSVLTVGYMLAQVPSNMLLTRVRPSMYIPATAIVWSAVSAATAGVTNASTLITVRFFLGYVIE